MQVKMKCESLAPAFLSKKGKAMKKFLVPDGNGGREVLTVMGDTPAQLDAINGEITVRYLTDFAVLA